VRNRSNSNATDTPSKRANRLPVLPELAGEQDVYCSALSSASSSSLCTTPSSSRCNTPNKKRLSRYGKDEFAFGGAFSVPDDFLSTAPRAAPRPPPSSTKQMRQSVRLSAFDFVIDISSEPASPVSDKPVASSTPPRDTRRWSPSRSRSPTPSLTSVSACSSTEVPTTPGASDDESPILRLPRKAISRPEISIHPLVLTKSTSTSEASPADTFEFALASFHESGDEDAEKEDQQDEDDALWYSRELSQVVSLSSHCAPSDSPARPDSLLPPPRSFSSGKDRSYGRSRMSKPLPEVPLSRGPSPQLDPTFPRCKSRPPRLPLRATPLPAAPSSPLALHPPAVSPDPETPSSYATPTASSAPARNSLTDMRRALPRSPLPLDVSDILDDVDAWSLATPSTSTSTSVLSPPHVPRSPASSSSSEEYDPIELIVSYAALPASPAMSTTSTTTASVTILQDGDEETEAETDCMTGDGDELRSRWSCSTLATLVPPGSPPPTSPSARLRFHLGSVARRVRSRRAGGSNGGEVTVDAPKTVALAHLRSSSEPATLGSVCASDDTAPFSISRTRRKPIPLELFSL